MERISVAEAARDFSGLMDRVLREGISVELERDDRPVARLSPVPLSPRVSVSDLNRIFSTLPLLGEELEPFARDLEAIRSGWEGQ